MTVIRVVEIENFRGVKLLTWCPGEGINCLVGPGDSGKSTMLDGIDYCIGARRSLQLADSDFHRLDVESPIRVAATLGALPDKLKGIPKISLAATFRIGGYALASSLPSSPGAKRQRPTIVILESRPSGCSGPATLV
jgi:putative ATP-dependent endonuclease of OLD family